MNNTKSQRLTEKIKRELGEQVINFLGDPSVIEILLNADHDLWVERLGKPMERIGSVEPVKAESALRTIASFLGEVLTKEQPCISCELPIDGSRFQGMIPPVVSAPVFAIRKKAGTVYSLEQYVEDKVITKSQHKRISQAVANHENIVIAGSTGSGKTTLTNAIIAEMVKQFPDERLVIIEDTNEIQCTARNSVTLRSHDNVSVLTLLQSTLRLRPDRILVGEVRGSEAWTLLKAWNTGHPGGVVTVHANDAHAALLRLEQLSAEDHNSPGQTQYLRQVIAECVHLVVFISKTLTGRIVKEMIQVQGYNNHSFLTTEY